MTVTASAGGVDILTRTTLQIDGSISAASIADIIQRLQRVPGVLLAEVDAVGGRATVAHDAGVPTGSLVSAAAAAGVHARLVAGTSAHSMNADAALCLKRRHIRRSMMIWAAVFITASLVEALVPNSPEKHWLLPVLTTLFWVSFLLAQAFATHRAKHTR